MCIRDRGHTRLALESRSKPKRAIAAGGHTSLAATLERISEQFTVLFSRKAFLTLYVGEGMDEMDIYGQQIEVKNAINEITDALCGSDAGYEMTPDE